MYIGSDTVKSVKVRVGVALADNTWREEELAVWKDCHDYEKSILDRAVRKAHEVFPDAVGAFAIKIV